MDPAGHSRKAVLFDFDGVLTTDRTGSWTTNQFLSRATGIPFDRLDTVFRKHNEGLLLGRITHANIWDSVCNGLGQRIDPALLVKAFESTPLNKPMIHLARRLKPRHKLGIVTDNKLDRMRVVIRHQNLDELFEAIVVSAEIGTGKDQAAIFEAAMTRLDVGAAECVFIDNQEKNLVVPRQLGMAVIHHDGVLNDISRLEGRLMDCGIIF